MISPLAEVTVRVRPVGGPVAAEARLKKEKLLNPISGGRVIVLIHGYNNSESDAKRAFSDFLSIMEKQAQRVAVPVISFYWPGDATKFQLISKLSYPFENGPARDSGQRLAKFLSSLSGPEGGPVEVHIIAHSLGNRVMVEMLRHALQQAHRTLFGTLVMMAAAVPVSYVGIVGKFRNALLHARRRIVLYSPWDEVLQKAFPIGQTACAEGWFPEAVGRYGAPAMFWNGIQEMVGYDHSDYWGGPAACNRAASAMGIPVPIPAKERKIQIRNAPASRSLQTESLDGRPIPRR